MPPKFLEVIFQIQNYKRQLKIIHFIVYLVGWDRLKIILKFDHFYIYIFWHWKRFLSAMFLQFSNSNTTTMFYMFWLKIHSYQPCPYNIPTPARLQCFWLKTHSYQACSCNFLTLACLQYFIFFDLKYILISMSIGFLNSSTPTMFSNLKKDSWHPCP